VTTGSKTRNSRVLASFVAYCEAHPHERFWQALRNWSGYHLILAADEDKVFKMARCMDTFNWEGERS
jgi:hypothetical protein